MPDTTNTHRTTIITAEFLSGRLEMWERQEAAQSSGDWHRALTLEQSIRFITSQIRQKMGLGTSAQEAEHCN